MLSTKLQLTIRDRKVLAVIFSLILVSSILIAYEAGVSGQTSTPISLQTNSGGIYSGSPTWTVWSEGGYTYAKDSHGAIQSSWTSTDPVVTINDALANAQGEVFLKAGTYMVSSATISVPSNVTLAGEGTSTILFAANGFNKDVIILNGASGATVKDLQVYGNYGNQNPSAPLGAGKGSGIYLYGAQRCTIENVLIQNPYVFGIYLDTSLWCNIVNNMVAYTGYDGIIMTSSDGISVQGNTVLYCGAVGVMGDAIAVYWGNTNCRVINNNIEHVSHGNGITIGALAAAGNTGCVVSGNTIKYAAFQGIDVTYQESYSWISKNIVSNNYVLAANQMGFYIRNASYIIISDNLAEQCTYGFYLNCTTNLELSGNIAVGNGRGIDIESSTWTHISGGSTNGNGNGVYEENTYLTSDYNLIEGVTSYPNSIVNIFTTGTHTHVRESWNGTTLTDT